MILSYQDALKYLYENLPMFQRVGPVAIKKDLTNTIRLCEILGNPQRSFRSVHVAGTNGKGSTCHMLASIFQTSGCKTGLYTSPHLKEFTERIKVNGREISQQYVSDFVNRIMPAIAEIRPSFFEITVAMAFDYFSHEQVDVAIIEVGLGGKLDSTNVITPLVSVITNISEDHTDLLGSSLTDIAGEKAGIIKSGIPVVISERQSGVEAVFIAKAVKENAQIHFASDEYSVDLQRDGETLDILRGDEPILANVRLPLHGAYQARNIPGVLKAIEILANELPVTSGQLKTGLEQVVENTGLKGRWQKLSLNPTVICDTGHNASGISEIVQQLARETYERLFIVWGMVKDKDPGQILGLLPKDATYYFCQANIPRALDANTLQEKATGYGLCGKVLRDVNEAIKAAVARAGPHDLIFIGGSTYVVAEIDGL